MIAALLFSALTAQPASVVLITVDTLRADFLGVMGTERVETPNLDALANRGVLFTRARAPVPLTLPSHASMLTGLYPPQHGVRDNGTYVLDDTHTTLAEALNERGYQTGAFVASFVLDRRFGLAQGFDRYDDDTVSSVEDLESPEAERRGEDVANAFETWLSGIDRDQPFFAWIHLYDPHAPYEPPEPYRSRYAEDPYAGEVAYADSVIGDILDLVDIKETIIAVAGDHGEGLHEHEEATHSLLIYNSTLHVPMIVAGPGVPRGELVDYLVRTIDLAPTILDYLGIEEDLGMGVSARDDAARTAYSESLYGFFHLGWSPLYGLETSTHRFIAAPEKELYDLRVDPKETRTVLEDQRAASRQLFRELNELREQLETSSAPSRELDPDTRERLESLGYMTSAAPASTSALPDPKRELDTYQRIQRAQLERNVGECRAALETLATIRQAIPLVYELRSQCHIHIKEWDEAARVLEQAIGQGMETSSFHLNLGIVAVWQGRMEAAEKELRVAIALDETSVSALYHLGDVLRAARRDAEAIDSYRRALAVNPDYVFAWNGLGMTLARSGEAENALEAFRQATRSSASDPRAHFNLALQAERLGLTDDAVEAYRRFIEVTDEASFPRERARAREALRRLARR